MRCLLLLGVLLGANAAQADDAPAKPAKAAVCAACHGETGSSPLPIYPHLAGQYADYLEVSLKEYRGGLRKNPVMAAQATGLTDADIRELARYFAAQPGPLYTPSVHGRPQN